jgi:deoxyribonuclease I
MLMSLLLLASLHSFADVKSDLRSELIANHQPITYKQANEILFTKLSSPDQQTCSVYSPSFCLAFGAIPHHTVMNIEHTWPQSLGAHGIAKSDLHHLFPATSSSNARRGSFPFCEVAVAQWQEDGSQLGFNEFGEHCFEPPAQHKGNVARALFYFATRYGFSIDEHQEMFLRKWNSEDLVDAAELLRNSEIKTFQNISNPFIDQSELVNEILDF